MSILSPLFSTAVLFFPIWMQIWEQEPIANQHLNTTGYFAVSPEALDKVREGLPSVHPDLRQQLMLELSETPIPANRILMLEWLASEREPVVQATILQLLQSADMTLIPAEAIRPFLASTNFATAEAAIRLYGRLPGADLQLLLPFLPADQAPGVPLKLRKAAWQHFSKNAQMASLLDARILDFQQDPALEIQALALQTAALLQPRRTEISSWLDRAAEGPALLRLAAARDPFPENAARLQTLLRDPEPGIRFAVCDSNPGSHPELILSALEDPDQAVRLAAVIALRRQPGGNNSQIVESLLKCFADPVRQVRQEAETSIVLCAEQGDGPARPRLAETLNVENPLQRLHAIQSLTRLRQQSAASAIADRIPLETLSENLSAGFLALARLASPGSYGNLLQQYAGHPSPLVRSAVARATGQLQPAGCEPVLQKLCIDRQSAAVRVEAFSAMGYFPRGVFASSLFTCLKNTGGTTTDERRNAAWAAGKLQPANPQEEALLVDLAKRLVVQCSQPVVPGMEPMFEGIDIIGNAMYSLVQLQKRFPGRKDFADCAQTVLKIYEVPWEQAQQMTSQSRQMPPPIDAATNSLAFQARQWLNGENITSTEIPVSTPSFSCSRFDE